MRFSVDAHAVGRKLTGNEVYIRNLLNCYPAIDASCQYIAYLSEPDAERHLDARIETRRVSRNPFKRLGWDLSRHLENDLPDLLHVQYTGPLTCEVPLIVSVHDVSFVERPEFFSWARASQLRRTVPRTIRMAARILTPSEFSARAIERVYPAAAGKITVVHNGVSGFFRPVGREQAQGEVRARYGIAAPYLLTVGDLQPRKNQEGLIEAFESILRAHPDLPHVLVLAGKANWQAERVHQRAARSPFRDRIRFTGFVPDEDLLHLYGGCDLFVFPSFYEGFGIPILEAMACGRAVACSDSSATAEVADGAALLFDPSKPDEIGRAIRDVLLDAELRSRLERLGQQRAAQFQWKTAASRTLDVYHEVAESRRRSLRDARSAVPAPR